MNPLWLTLYIVCGAIGVSLAAVILTTTALILMGTFRKLAEEHKKSK